MSLKGPDVTEKIADYLKSLFIAPLIESIQDCLEDLPNKEYAFEKILELMAQGPTKEQKELLVNKGNCEVDELLVIQINSILPKATLADFRDLYGYLFTYVHEYCLNKEPDSLFKEEKNAQVAEMIADAEDASQSQEGTDPYAMTEQDCGPLSLRIHRALFLTTDLIDNDLFQALVLSVVQSYIKPSNENAHSDESESCSNQASASTKMAGKRKKNETEDPRPDRQKRERSANDSAYADRIKALMEAVREKKDQQAGKEKPPAASQVRPPMTYARHLINSLSPTISAIRQAVAVRQASNPDNEDAELQLALARSLDENGSHASSNANPRKR